MFSGFNIGSVFIGSYAICAVVGIFIAFPLAVYRYKKLTGDGIPLIFVCFFAAVGVFIGMHLLYGITNISYWNELTKAADFKEFAALFISIFGGSVFYGGLIGGIIAGGISIKVQKLPADTAADCLAPAIALFHGFARIGCFMAGCCYGVEWEHGITFTSSIVESANGVPRIPVQLIEAGFEFLLAGLLWFLLLKVPKSKGRLLPLYLLIYSVGRFILEFWRGDEYRGFIFGLSTSQFISIFVFIGGVIFLVLKSSKQLKKERDQT